MSWKLNQVIWASTFNQPTWPALIYKIINKVYSVKFFNEQTTANVSAESIYDYFQHKNQFNSIKNKKLQKAMNLAEKFIQKSKKQTTTKSKSPKNFQTDLNSSRIDLRRSNVKSITKQSKKGKKQIQLIEIKDDNQNIQQLVKKIKPSITTTVKKNNRKQMKILEQKSKKQIIMEKINKKKNIHEQQLRQQMNKSIAQVQQISLTPLSRLQQMVIKQKKSNQNVNNLKTVLNNQLKILDFQTYLLQYKLYTRSVDQKISNKLQEALIHIIRTSKSSEWDHEKIKSHISQGLQIHGNGINIQSYLSSKISNIITFLHKKLRQKQPIIYLKEIQNLQIHMEKIQKKVSERLFNIDFYINYQKMFHNKEPQKDQQYFQLKKINRLETIKIILEFLKLNFNLYNQQLHKDVAAKIQSTIFESKHDYMTLIQKLSNHLKNKKKYLISLTLENFLDNILRLF